MFLLLPGGEDVTTDHGGVVVQCQVVASEANFLQREAKGQEVGTDGQTELQQETTQEEVLGLKQEVDIKFRGKENPLKTFQVVKNLTPHLPWNGIQVFPSGNTHDGTIRGFPQKRHTFHNRQKSSVTTVYWNCSTLLFVLFIP